MQPQYSLGAAPSHHPPPYAPPEVSANGGSITSSLRQWRKKDYLEKQQSTEQPQTSVAENPSHVARVAPHTYYPRLTNDVCHYQHQYTEYGVPYKPPAPTPVKYSEIVDNPQAQTIEHITPVIPKLKDKEFGDMCSVPPQPHLKQYQDQMTMKQSYPDGTKQTYSDPTVHHQYISKESQIHQFLQKQSQMHQYIQKEPYQQFLPKYGMQGQYPQSYPSEPNNFLAHLNKINPRMAQSIINDTHLRDPQIPMYHSLEQNRSYPQPQRMYHPPSMHSSPTHTHRNVPQSYNYAQPYNYNVKSSMQPNDPYNRVHQYQHNVPKYLPEYKMNAPIEQPVPNISPQRMYNESVHMNYAPMPPKISPNYPHCSQLEYAQHYQHRRAPLAQDYYSHSGYKSGYVQNPQVSPEGSVSDSRMRKSSLKQYLETWVEEDMSGNLPDLVVSSNNLSDVENMENVKGTMCVKGSGTQEQPLYVLDTTEIPNENLPHFLHLQQFEKLPDNVRGYYHSTSAVPPASRRIIVENNSSEGLPENSQVIRGNSAPIVPKLSEGFAENGHAVAIENESVVNQSAAENQRKIVASEEAPANMGSALENQIQSLENKVVQIHIVEDSEAATSESEITATLSTHSRTAASPSETVIIQSHVYQHDASQPDPFAKIIGNDAIKKPEDESPPSPSETEIESEDDIKNMPVIDESTGVSVVSEIITEEIFIPPKDAANSVHEGCAEEEIPEDLQTCESASSRRSSICSIYKEMEHIHGENSAGAAPTNFESDHIQKSPPTDSENVPVSEQETCKSVSSGSINSGKTDDLQQNSDENVEQNKPEELNAKDEHSKLESEYSRTCDASPTDLTNFTNPETPFRAANDKLEVSETESAKARHDAEVQENENHRQISKKLRTAKPTAPNISEECSPEGRTTTVTTNNINSAAEFFQENIKSPDVLEHESDTVVAAPFEIDDNLPLNTKETSCGSAIKTILQIPKICAINSQISNESSMPTKESCFNEASLESSEETRVCDELNRPESLSPVEDVQINVNDASEPPTNTSFETAPIVDFVDLEKNKETNIPSDESIIEDSDHTELENLKNITQTESISETTGMEADAPENCEESVSHVETLKNPKEIFLAESDRDDAFVAEATKPLNLSVDKKCADNKPKPNLKSANVSENHAEPPALLDNQTRILDDADDSLDGKLVPEEDNIATPEDLTVLVEDPKKPDVCELSTSNIKSSTKPVEAEQASPNLSEEKEENTKPENLAVRNTNQQVDVAPSNGTELENESEEEKCVNINLEEISDDTLDLSNSTSNDEISLTLTEAASEEEEIDSSASNSNDKVDMPELVAVSNEAKSKHEEAPGSASNLTQIGAENSLNDKSNTRSDTEIPEATMPVLKSMVDYDKELEPSNVNNNSVNLEAPFAFSNKTKAPKSKTAKISMVKQKKLPRTPKKKKFREKIAQRESDLRRKSRRLNRSVAINQESKEEPTAMPALVKEDVLQVKEAVDENPQSIVNTEEEMVSDNNNFEREDKHQIVNSSECGANVATPLCADTSQKSEEETETVNNFDQNNDQTDTEQNIPADGRCNEEPSDIPENVTKEEESEKDFLEENRTEQTINNNQAEDFEPNDTSIVYQINDTNVVLQIADELLEINVTTQNGRKIISVKTFSDAIIMNNTSDETPLEEPPTELEDSNANVEDPKLSENVTPLNNNYIDVSNLNNTNTDIEDEANVCFKEICTATDITTVGDDVFIYNEEVVSSSTEIEAVSKPPIDKEEPTEAVADKNVQKKYITRKSSKRDKKVSWQDEKYNLDETKCLTGAQKKPQKEDAVRAKVDSIIPESGSDTKPASIKDSLRKSPKTKAALKFVETVKTSKPKFKESKVPSKATVGLRTHPNVAADIPAASDKSVAKLPKKQPPAERNSVKEETRTDSCVKNAPKQRYHAKNESHSNSNKDKPEEKPKEAPKTKEKPPSKDPDKAKDVHVKTKRSLSPKEEKPHHNKPSKLPQTPKKKPKIEKATEEPPKAAKAQADNKKSQKPKAPPEETPKNIKKEPVHSEIAEKPQVPAKKAKSKSEEQPKTRAKQKTEPDPPVPEEEPAPEEIQISVQENSITSSTCQETEASIKQRKLIQQITDDWDDDSDDLKAAENSCKRRLSLQEYNSRKRTTSIAEQETACDLTLTKPDLTDDLFGGGSVLIGPKCKREISPESPVLSVKFNNKTYSRSSSLYSLKPNPVSHASDHEQDAIPKEPSPVLDFKKEEPLSSAIELHLPRINRSPRPAYNQEYLRNALMHDLQAVNAYTTTLIKENQQLMQRFLEQKRLSADELKKVKTIIRYKRLVQHLSTIRINEMQTPSARDRSDTDHLLYPTNSSLHPAAHLKLIPNFNAAADCDVNKRQSNVNQIVASKLSPLPTEELVKVNVEKRKKKRFRFLYSDEESEPPQPPAPATALTDDESSLKKPRLDSSVPALDPKVMDYSVHQSNSQGQLTLVFKRSFKSDPKMQPFVRLERLPSIDLLAKNRLH